MTKVVTIGGGTGTHTLLTGLKQYSDLELTSVVTVADSGGSTGRLRDEFGYLPVGDFRMALTALAPSDEEADVLRSLFLYRFSKGEDGLKGHNFGNLFLVALADVLGSYEKALVSASKILRARGRVLPISNSPINLFAEYEDGTVYSEEAQIDEPPEEHNGEQKIKSLWVEPRVPIAQETMHAILEADYIIIGPGDLYTSILANIVIDGTSAAIKKSNAKIIYVGNLVTKYGQTYGFSAKDHLNELVKYMGRNPNFVLLNKGELPERILEKYEQENDYPVVDDLGNLDGVIRADLLVPREIKKKDGDAIRRSLLRHDPDKLAWEIVKIIKEDSLTAQSNL